MRVSHSAQYGASHRMFSGLLLASHFLFFRTLSALASHHCFSLICVCMHCFLSTCLIDFCILFEQG